MLFCVDEPGHLPGSENFDPERWLDKEKRLDKYLVSFGKGLWQCLGLIWRMRNFISQTQRWQVGLIELYETSLKYVQIKHDFFVAVSDLSSKGVRVTVKERSTASTG